MAGARFAQAIVGALERLVFARRTLLVSLFLALTLLLGWQALQLRPSAGFERMIPQDHPFLRTLSRHQDYLGAPGTTVRIAVENGEGEIFDPRYLGVLHEVTRELYYLRGVDRNALRSLWTPNVRWSEIAGAGIQRGAVMPKGWDGSPRSLAALRRNVMRSGEVGRLVADDLHSSIVEAEVQDRDPVSGAPLDYRQFARELESKIRARYEQGSIRIHITGFARSAGELIDGAGVMLLFALIAIAVTAVVFFLHTRCLAATLAPLLCALVAVTWQLGLLHALGLGLDAWSLAAPFLVFAIGAGHGMQVVEAIGRETLAGRARLPAARHAMRELHAPGIAALAVAAASLLALLAVDIGATRAFGVAAALGIAALVPCNLALLPVLLSHTGICLRGRQRIERRERHAALPWRLLAHTASPAVAALSLLLAVAAGVFGAAGARELRIGDADPGAGAPTAGSRHLQDDSFVSANYSAGPDALVVLVETQPGTCYRHRNLERIDRFAWTMRNLPGVQSAGSLADVAREYSVGMHEGSLKWSALPRSQRALEASFGEVPPQQVNNDCSLAPVTLELADRAAATRARVVDAVQQFARANDGERVAFRLAAGSAGIAAAIDQELGAARWRVPALALAAAALLALACFRGPGAAACIVLPLALVALLQQALMARLGTGLQVATLPVLALVAALGAIQAFHVLDRLRRLQRQGVAPQEAWLQALRGCGAAVCVSGVALALGAATWAWSPVGMQAGFGLLLAASLLMNTLCAVWLLPALACFLLRKPAP